MRDGEVLEMSKKPHTFPDGNQITEDDKELLRKLCKAYRTQAAQLDDIGKKMFTMFTQDGFPPDMFLDELAKRMELTQDMKLYIISQYQTLMLEHRRTAGITEARVNEIRKRNREVLKQFIKTGEAGYY